MFAPNEGDWTETPSVLVAISNDGDALRIARAFAQASFAPVLAFDRSQLQFHAGTPGLVALVIDETLDPRAAVADAAAATTEAVVVLLGDMTRSAERRVHAVLPRDVEPVELVLRTRALLELHPAPTSDGLRSWGDLHLDVRRRKASWGDRSLDLTPVQFRILLALVKARGAVVTKRELERAAWPWMAPDNGDRLVAHVRRIRAKLPGSRAFLITARGEGFRLADSDEAATR